MQQGRIHRDLVTRSIVYNLPRVWQGKSDTIFGFGFVKDN